MSRFQSAIVTVLWAAFLVPAAVAQSVVSISAGREVGQGLGVMRSGDCMVLTVAHVVGEGRNKITTQTAQYGLVELELVNRANALLPLPNGDAVREDLALLKVKHQDPAAVCNDNLARFSQITAPTILTTDGSSVRFIDIKLRDSNAQTVTFEFTDQRAGQAQGLSGAPILVGGTPRGMVVRLATSGGETRQSAYSIDLLVKEFGSWAGGKSSDLAQSDQALSVLDRVRQSLPQSDIGQVAAIKTLAGGGPVAGLDFKGFFLEKASFSRLDASRSDFTAAMLSSARFETSNLSGTIFDFVAGRDLVLAGSNLSKAHHQYADYDGADFSGADLRQGNFYFATLRRANLRNADLRGANLSYADLTGADIAGAKFDNAILYGAVLNDVRGLGEAIFANTSVVNMVGASRRRFTDAEVCGYQVRAGGFDYARFVKKTPSAQYNDGFKYDILGEEGAWNYMPAAVYGMSHSYFLKPCAAPPDDMRAVGTQYQFNAAGASLSLGADRTYTSDFLGRRGISQSITSRLSKRNQETLTAIGGGDFIVPATDRDVATAQHINQLTAQIRNVRIDCLDGETLPHLLRGRGADKGRSSRQIMAQIYNQILDDAQKLKKAREYEGTGKVKIDPVTLLPFGTISLDPEASIGQLTAKNSFGPATIKAYENWSEQRGRRAGYAFCFQKSGQAVAGHASYSADAFTNEPLTMGDSRVVKALQGMAVHPTFTAVLSLNGNYRTIAVFIDKVPPFVGDRIAKKRPSPGEALQPTEQLQELVEITSVEQADNAPLVILKAKYLGRRTMSFLK